MGAEDVINFLEEHKGQEFTTTEISDVLNISLKPIRVVVSNLLSDPFVKVKRRTLTFKEKKQKYHKVINAQIFVYKLI